MIKIGHRGAKGYEAENTLASFQKAIELNLDGFELDVRMSADRKVVVIHDQTIDRTTTEKGFVSQYTAAELKVFGIPQLNEVLDLIQSFCFVNVEIKEAEATNQVVQLIKHYTINMNWTYQRFLVSSFDWKILEEVVALDPLVPIGVLTKNELTQAIDFSKKIKAFAIHPHHSLLNKQEVIEIQKFNLKVFPWTVNERIDIEKMKAFNVNGIISDFPDRI